MSQDHSPAQSCMASDVQRLRSDVAEIKQAIIGNPNIGHRGIVPRLDLMESTVSTLVAERAAEHNARRGAMWVVGIAAGVIGAIGATIGSLLKALFSNHG
jgi:hypothetical protein